MWRDPCSQRVQVSRPMPIVAIARVGVQVYRRPCTVSNRDGARVGVPLLFALYRSVATVCRTLLDANGGRTAKIWINECVDPFLPAKNTSTLPDKLRRYPNSSLDPRQPCGGIPAALDLVSVDNYFSWSSDQNSVPPSERRHPTWIEEAWVVRDFYRDYVIQRLLPHQRLIVVPGLFGNDSTTPTGLQRTIGEQMVDRLDAYWDWLSGKWRDDLTNSSAWVVGLAPFHWFQRGDSTGASNYSEVIAKLRVIGKVVQENSRRLARTSQLHGTMAQSAAAAQRPMSSSPASAFDWATVATVAVLRDHANFTIGEAMQDWQVANAIDSVAIYTAQAPPGAPRDHLTEVLQRAFKVVNSTAPNPSQCCPGSWGAGNDDVQWGLFAWVHTYEALGSRPQDFVLIEAAARYLDWVIANEAVWRTETNGTANQCGRGYHNEPKYDCNGNADPQDFKNSVTNTQFLTSAMLLHPFAQRLGRPQGYYLRKALSEWQWLEGSGLRNSTTGLYAGGLNMQTCRPSTDPNGGAWVATYNQGILLPGLAKLARATKNQTLLMQACDTVAAVVENMTTPDGVLHETPTCDVFWGGPCDRWAVFKGAYMRGIRGLLEELRSPGLSEAHLSVPPGCLTSIKQIVTDSAHSAWYRGRCPHSNNTNDAERAQWSYDWTGSRPNFLQTCNASRAGVNLPSANVAAADVFNALVALAE